MSVSNIKGFLYTLQDTSKRSTTKTELCDSKKKIKTTPSAVGYGKMLTSGRSQTAVRVWVRALSKLRKMPTMTTLACDVHIKNVFGSKQMTGKSTQN